MATPLHSALRAFRGAQPASALLRSSMRSAAQRRSQTTASDAAKDAAKDATKAAGQSGFARLWNSPVGPKTVHFWAPIMKWGIVIAGINDLRRPVESISLQQNAALVATGAIWTRWCFVIRPQNIFLATVNFFLFCTGAAQVSRILMHRSQNGLNLYSGEPKLVAKQ